MAKPKLDFKKLMLERGERIGLSVAGIITLLLLLVSLLWPGKGVFSGSPDEKAKGLTEPAAYINQRLSDPNNTPGEEDMPAKNSNEKLIALEMKTIDADKFRMASLIPEDGSGSQGRRAVRVLGVDDAVVKLARMQIQTYIMDNNGNIYVLVGKEGSAKGGKGESFSKQMMGKGGMMGMGMGGKGSGMAPPGGRMGRFAPPKGMGNAGGSGEEKPAKRLTAIPLAKLAGRTDATLAEQVHPLRMAIIAASFPYKAQVEEFRSKLALRSANEVLTEQGEKVKINGKELQVPSFHFTGVEVERRELDLDGKPIAKSGEGWTKLDLLGEYQPYVILSGKRFEEDDPDLKAISFPGLVWPRLQGFRPENVGKGDGATGGATGGAGAPPGAGTAMRPPMGSGLPPGMRPPMASGKGPGDDGKEEGAGKHKDLYPPVERELPEIRKTLETIKGKAGTEVLAPPARFQGFTDIFDATSSAEPKEKDGDGKTTGDPKTDPDAVREIPEHCLVRVIDVNIQPGKTYEYRLRVKMVNPNYGRSDVASPAYRKDAELSSEWSKKTVRVQVEPELRYYAVDQKKLQPKNSKYDGINANSILTEDKEVWLQADRWVERTKIRPTDGDAKEVGEWAVAERFKATRGEYVGRPIRVQLPIWRVEREEFVLADDFRGKGRSAQPSIDVDFGYGPNGTATQPEAIVVDFRGTRHAIEKVVKRNEDGAAPTTAKVSDDSATEVLLLDPNGRLRLLEGGLDAIDPKRIERREHYRERVKEISQSGKKDDGGGNGKTFDK